MRKVRPLITGQRITFPSLRLWPLMLAMLLLTWLTTALADQPPRPTLGMTQEYVAQTYGDPLEVTPAVGVPPITRWHYDTYTVYFEHRRVLRSVEHHQPGSRENPLPLKQ